MFSFLDKYRWYRDATKLWHLTELNKQLDAVSAPLCEKFKHEHNNNDCSIGCPFIVEGVCVKDVIKKYTEKERNVLDEYYDA